MTFESAQEIVQTANLQDIYALEYVGGKRDHEVWFYGPYVLRIHPDGRGMDGETRVLRTFLDGKSVYERQRQ